jgi:hypothetical protein
MSIFFVSGPMGIRQVGDVEAMHKCLSYCRRAGGLLLVTPADRLSLNLKRHELRQKGQVTGCRERIFSLSHGLLVIAARDRFPQEAAQRGD